MKKIYFTQGDTFYLHKTFLKKKFQAQFANKQQYLFVLKN